MGFLVFFPFIPHLGLCLGFFWNFSIFFILHTFGRFLQMAALKPSGNHFHFLKEPFDMFRFTITELKHRTLCVRKTRRSFLSLLPQMSHLSQSVQGQMIFWRLDPVWSPGCLNPRVKPNDGTVLPKFDPVWSLQIRSAKIIQPKGEPKLELTRLTKWLL